MKALKSILNAVVTAIFTIVLVAVVALVAPRLVGVSAFAVLSGSMEPLYPTGSVVYVNTNVNTQNLMPGEIITFMIDQNTVVTHRIVNLETGEDGITRYQTQGDANDQPDAKLVHPGNVIGTPVFCVPYVGHVVGWVSQPPGTYLAVCGAAIVVFLMFLPDLFPSKKREEDEENEGEEKSETAGEQHGVYAAQSASNVPAAQPNQYAWPNQSVASFQNAQPMYQQATYVGEEQSRHYVSDADVAPRGRHAGTDKTQRAGKHARVSEEIDT